MTHLSLFSGIGGIDLAAEWAGFRTVAFVEKDPFCQKVLAKHWPEVPIYDDVTTFNGEPFRGVSLISGGFPCQDVSSANITGQGIDGARSGLWREMHRIVRVCQPLFVLVENVRNLRNRGADRVLSDLEEIGYTVGAFVVAAGSAGAPHIRQRVFLVAHANDMRELQPQGRVVNLWRRTDNGAAQGLGAYPKGQSGLEARSSPVRERVIEQPRAAAVRVARRGPNVSYWRVHQPPMAGVDARLPNRVDRARALGNTVCPHQVAPILQAIADQLCTEGRRNLSVTALPHKGPAE